MKVFITAPLVGALIGYITNYIAIKMLFRPLHAKYLFGIRLPFTPGIIPREKSRIAKSIGAAVGEKLLTKDVIEHTLLSSDFHKKLEEFIDIKMKELTANNITAGAAAENLLGSEPTEKVISQIQYHVTDFLHKKINEPEVIANITSHLSKGIDQYIEKQMTNPLIKMVLSFNTGIVDSIKDNIVSKISSLLYTDSRDVIDELIRNELTSIREMELDDIMNKFVNNPDAIKTAIINVIDKIVVDNLDFITTALNIPAMIEKQINDYDIYEVEELILSIVDKELKAIIWLGALLGFIMGFIMPLLPG